jgi:hypothetical protein
MHKFTDVLRLGQNDMQRLDRRRFNSSADSTEQEPAEAEEQQAAVALNKIAIADPEPSSKRLSSAEERKQHLQGGIQEISMVMLDDFTLDEVLGMILETIYRGIGFDRVVIFFKDPRSGMMQARYGLGANTASIVKEVSFSEENMAKDLFNMALNENKDLYIGNIADVEVRDFRPTWFDGAIYSPSFALYPIVINQKKIGLIYCGHDDAGEHLSQEHLSAMKTLRNQAALAIKQCFAGA